MTQDDALVKWDGGIFFVELHGFVISGQCLLEKPFILLALVTACLAKNTNLTSGHLPNTRSEKS
jgi:hypothetical protein